MIGTSFKLDDDAIRKLNRVMKEADPKSVTALRRDLRTRIQPIGREVAGRVPTESPFKGMRRNLTGRVQWSVPKVRVSFAPGRSVRQRGWAPVVTVVLEDKKKLGFAYTENAGPRRRPKRPETRSYQRQGDSVTRTHANTTQGDALIAKAKRASSFNFKAGHFAYGHFLKRRPLMIQLAQVTLNKVAKEFSVKLERM